MKKLASKEERLRLDHAMKEVEGAKTKALISTTGQAVLNMYDPTLYQVVWFNIFAIDGAPYQDELTAGNLPLEEWQSLFYQREEAQYGGVRDALEPWGSDGVTRDESGNATGPARYATKEEWHRANDYECYQGLSRCRRSRELISTMRSLRRRTSTTRSVRTREGRGKGA